MKVSIIHIMLKLNLVTICNWHCVDAFLELVVLHDADDHNVHATVGGLTGCAA
jgi:hypothetical protein